MVEGGGFEPPKSMTTDLQSVPFGRSGIPPDEELLPTGADDGTRTRNLLITSQLLYQLSYTSALKNYIYYKHQTYKCQYFFEKLFIWGLDLSWNIRFMLFINEILS